MGLFGGIGSFLGIGGDQTDVGGFQAGAGAAAGALRRFRPFRTTSALGTTNFSQEDGVTQFDIDSSFLTEALGQFGEAQTGGSDAILALLRQRAEPEFGRQFNRLESRALSQVRLGLSTGNRGGTPEFTSFFNARQDADLGFQLQAFEESRRNREFLLGEAGGIQGLLTDQFQGLLQGEGLNISSQIAAGNLDLQGLIAALQARIGQESTDNSLFGGAISSIGVGPISASF